MQCGLSSLEERPHFLPEAPFLPEALTCKSKILFLRLHFLAPRNNSDCRTFWFPIYEKNVRNAL